MRGEDALGLRAGEGAKEPVVVVLLLLVVVVVVVVLLLLLLLVLVLVLVVVRDGARVLERGMVRG